MKNPYRVLEKEKISCVEEVEIRIDRLTELFNMAFALGDNFHYAADNEANEIFDKRMGEEKDEIYEVLENIDRGCMYWETQAFSIHEEVEEQIRVLEKIRNEINERSDLVKFLNKGKPN